MIAVWTGNGHVTVRDTIHAAWVPFELSIDDAKWLLSRRFNARPLLSVEDAVSLAESYSDASLGLLLRQLGLSSLDELLARLGAAKPAPKPAPKAEDLGERDALIVLMRDEGATWAQVAEAFGLAESTVRTIYSRTAIKDEEA